MNSSHLKQFCILLAATGIAAPALSQAAVVDSSIAQVRATRAANPSENPNKEILTQTIARFKADSALAHVDAHADAHADVSPNARPQEVA